MMVISLNLRQSISVQVSGWVLLKMGFFSFLAREVFENPQVLVVSAFSESILFPYAEIDESFIRIQYPYIR
ncbi:MAG: hypothetical protein JW902_10195 [Syntrophaceae bacterium]|nr:hypothetical protein [Syntrophaceae bacterium]